MDHGIDHITKITHHAEKIPRFYEPITSEGVFLFRFSWQKWALARWTESSVQRTEVSVLQTTELWSIRNTWTKIFRFVEQKLLFLQNICVLRLTELSIIAMNKNGRYFRLRAQNMSSYTEKRPLSFSVRTTEVCLPWCITDYKIIFYNSCLINK